MAQVAYCKGGYPLVEIYEKLGISDTSSYTADLVMEGPDVPAMTMKLYYKNGDIRAEGEQGGMQFVTITKVSGTIFTYNSAMNIWMKTAMDEVVDKEKMPDYKAVGTKTVDDMKCKVFETVDPESGTVSKIYVNDSMVYQVESTDKDGKVYVMKYTNREKKVLADKLFLPDEGANVQDLSALMKGLKNP